jgi:hypothetical protein
VAGVAADQVAVLVAEVGHDGVAEAGDVLAGAGPVLRRRAVRRVGAVQVGRRGWTASGTGARAAVDGVARAGQVLDGGRGLGLRAAGDVESPAVPRPVPRESSRPTVWRIRGWTVGWGSCAVRAAMGARPPARGVWGNRERPLVNWG